MTASTSRINFSGQIFDNHQIAGRVGKSNFYHSIIVEYRWSPLYTYSTGSIEPRVTPSVPAAPPAHIANLRTNTKRVQFFFPNPWNPAAPPREGACSPASRVGPWPAAVGLCLYRSYQLYSEMVGGRIFKRIGREYKGRNHDSVRQCAYWGFSTLSNGFYSLPISNHKNLRTHHTERTIQHLSNVRYVKSVTATVLPALGVPHRHNTQ